MSGTNGRGGPGAGAAVTVARPVVLVRYRSGVTGETARTVHVVPLPTNGQADAVSALCGAVLMLDDIETVTPGEGMPCTVCVINQVTGTAPTGVPPAGSAAAAGLAAGGIAYQEWGWPVTRHRDQVWLSLHRDVGETVGKDQDDKDKDNDKDNDSGSKHGQEDNTDDVSRDRPVPDRADPNKHDR